jgi:hypothetical protein
MLTLKIERSIMLNYQTWLEKQNTIRILLVQVDVLYNGTTTTKYFSTHGVTVDGIEYPAIMRNGFSLTESISLEYTANISYGDIEVINGNGELDIWITSQYVWVNKPIRVYVGELPQAGATSTIGDFEQIFNGVVSDIDSKDRYTLNLKVRDKLEKLNTSISEALLGNYYNGVDNVDTSVYVNQNNNSIRPVCFGEVFNITPLLSDPVNLHYMVNTIDVERIIEVRDNGVPVLFTQTSPVPAGSFQLLKSPVGIVTCSVQGTKQVVSTSTGAVTAGYSDSGSNTILTILRLYGKALDSTEIDLASFTTLGTYSVGVYLSERANVLKVCQDIARDCGHVLTITRQGKVRLVDLKIPNTYVASITESDILLNTLSISKKLDVIAGVKLGYSKNYTQQPNLLTAIPQQHKDFYASDYTESVKQDLSVKSAYSITVEPALQETYLIDGNETDVVSLSMLNLFKVPRIVYKFTGTARLLSVQLGDGIQLSNISRFGLSSSIGLVISTSPNWTRGTIDLEVLV